MKHQWRKGIEVDNHIILTKVMIKVLIKVMIKVTKNPMIQSYLWNLSWKRKKLIKTFCHHHIACPNRLSLKKVTTLISQVWKNQAGQAELLEFLLKALEVLSLNGL